MNKIVSLLVIATTVLLASCKRGYEPITYGEEACAHCKMTIVDDRFAAEVVDSKGKVYKFDDVLCMKQYISEQKKEGDNLWFVEDYLRKQEGTLDATKAMYLKHEFFSSPMNGDYAAFVSAEDAQHFLDSLGITPLKWENLQ